MRDFIFDQFGYFEGKEDDDEFDYQGWHFKLIAHEKKENELSDLNALMKQNVIKYNFGKGVDIVKTRSDTYIALLDDTKISLVSVKNCEITLNNLLDFIFGNLGVVSKEKLTFSHMIDLWEEKLVLLEEKLLPSIKIDDFAYKYTLEEAIYCIGLANNAVQYLEDAKHDYGDEITRLTFVHKRIKNLNSFDLLNPFNIVIDSPIRDLAGLYKNNYLNNDELIKIIDKYKLTKAEISLLFARIMFPTNVFDLLENHYINKENIKVSMLEFFKNNNEFTTRLKNLHKLLTTKYYIRPIPWIEVVNN